MEQSVGMIGYVITQHTLHVVAKDWFQDFINLDIVIIIPHLWMSACKVKCSRDPETNFIIMNFLLHAVVPPPKLYFQVGSQFTSLPFREQWSNLFWQRGM